MAEDRTPRTISLTECPPEAEVQPKRKRERSERIKETPSERESAMPDESKRLEGRFEERLGPRVI